MGIRYSGYTTVNNIGSLLSIVFLVYGKRSITMQWDNCGDADTHIIYR